MPSHSYGLVLVEYWNELASAMTVSVNAWLFTNIRMSQKHCQSLGSICYENLKPTAHTSNTIGWSRSSDKDQISVRNNSNKRTLDHISQWVEKKKKKTKCTDVFHHPRWKSLNRSTSHLHKVKLHSIVSHRSPNSCSVFCRCKSPTHIKN